MLIVAAQVLKILNYDPNIFNLPFLDAGLKEQTDAYIQNLIFTTYGVQGIADIPVL